jgi:tyrosine-protein kinase Etk/Wzc
MNKEYRLDREYSFVEIIQYNLRKWWLAVIFAIVCAAILGGYKYLDNYQYVENQLYEDKLQAVTSLYMKRYNDGSVVERANNIMKLTRSKRGYEKFCEITGYDLTLNEYTNLFDMLQGEASDVVSIYVTYPASSGGFSIMEEEEAIAFSNALAEVAQEISKEVVGEDCVEVLDAPYITSEVQQVNTYTITKEDFQRGVMKAITAGILLGIIVEVVLYTFWMLLWKKPKDAEEVRRILDTNVIDFLKEGKDNEEAFKKVALYLKGDEQPCTKVSCLSVHSTKKDAALKLAMSYANEQKKTLYVDLAVNEGTGDNAQSLSSYILGEIDEVKVLPMNAYLDSVSRNPEVEKGLNVTGNKRFATFLEEMSSKYEYIVVSAADVTKSADAYVTAQLCDKTFVVCSRKQVTNEELYRAKNTADVNGITIDGVLVYEL